MFAPKTICRGRAGAAAGTRAGQTATGPFLVRASAAHGGPEVHGVVWVQLEDLFVVNIFSG